MPIERRGSTWRVRARSKNHKDFQVTVDSESLALSIEEMLGVMKKLDRTDLLEALAARVLDAQAVWEAVKVQVPGREQVFIPSITAAVTVASLKAYHIAQGVRLAAEAPRVAGPAATAEEGRLGHLRDEFIRESRTGAYLSGRHAPFAPSTLERYEVSLDGFFGWAPSLKSESATSLTTALLEEFRVARINAGTNPATYNRDAQAIRSFLEWMKERRPQYAPTQMPEFVMMREASAQERAMTEEHFTNWWRTLREHPALLDYAAFVPLFALVGSCGLRIDEAMGLRRCDIEFENGRPKWANVREYPSHLLKSPAARRVVGLTDDVIPMIEGALENPGAPTDRLWPERLQAYHRVEHVFNRTCILAGLHDGGAGYLSDCEAQLKRQADAGELTKLGMEVQLERVKERIPRAKLKARYSIHSLRHTLATRLEEDGMSLNSIRMLLGQMDIETTMRYVGKTLTRSKATDAAMRSVRVLPFTTLGAGPHREGLKTTKGTNEVPIAEIP